MEDLLRFILIVLVIIVIINLFLGRGLEGMEEVPRRKPRRRRPIMRPYDGPIMYKAPHAILSTDDDAMRTDLRFDSGFSEPPLIQHGEFTESLRGYNQGAEYTNDEIPSLICASKIESTIDRSNFFRPL